MYVRRRNQLAKKIGKDSIAIISSGTEAQRNGDVFYRFRQTSSFYYLTGFNEPEAVLVLLKDGAQSILFTQSHDKTQEIRGIRSYVERAQNNLRVLAFHYFEIESYLRVKISH